MHNEDTPRLGRCQINLVGQRFGRLVVIRSVNPHPSRPRRTLWLCLCDCGSGNTVETFSLKSGNTASCGCLRKSQEGFSTSLTYSSWKSMMARCYKPSSNRHEHYRTRGIIVCDLWRTSFSEFHRDMGDRPNGTSIDRIDNDGIYCPNNCRWATMTVQQNNTTKNRYLEFGGKRMNITQWGKETGLGMFTIRDRLRYGWSVEDALTKPKSK